MRWSWSYWKRVIRNTNSVRMIMIALLFHSVASIVIIYLHLLWFFIDDEKVFQKGTGPPSKEAGIFQRRVLTNLLVSNIILESNVTTSGWWMEHSKWGTNVVCLNERMALCTQSLETTCKTDRIRAIYQYIPIKDTASVRGLRLSLTAILEHLDLESNDAYFGALGLVKRNDGDIETFKLQFKVASDEKIHQSVIYKAKNNGTVQSVTIMLLCTGYSGSVKFTDMLLLPLSGMQQPNWNSAPEIISHCPEMEESLVINESGSLAGSSAFKEENLISTATTSPLVMSEVVTLVTQVSMDRLSVLEYTLPHWNGPVSLVIFVSTKNTADRAEWQKLYLQKKLQKFNFKPLSSVKAVFGLLADSDYPINYLRNSAIKEVKTKYMLILDADFQPCPNFQHHFIKLFKQHSFKKKTVFIIPAFEYTELPGKEDSVPQTKEEVLQLLHRDDPFIQPFRQAEAADSHRLTNYWHWYRATKPYELHKYSDMYEPYIVIEKADALPSFDERFVGYGMNKVSFITELYAAGHEFFILPDVWAIHIPHSISTFTVNFLQKPYLRLKNRMNRFEFLREIMKKYKVGDCKQKYNLQ